MSEENPYAWQSAEYAQNGDREMFDQEARMRIAEALHTSHFPMMCFAILLLLGGLFLGGADAVCDDRVCSKSVSFRGLASDC